MLINTLEQSLDGIEVPTRYWLAYSGGLDSRVLLELLVMLAARREDFPPIHLIHVHHGLQDGADDWAASCARVAESLGLPLVVKRVSVCEAGEGLEAAARRARYQVFKELVQAGEVLLLAHHLDDQAETLMQRLLRGAGAQGLSAMPRQRAVGGGLLLRPLLDVPRADLYAFARSRELVWQDDPSNDVLHFDRNYLRHQLMPVLAKRWPAYRRSFARVAELSAQNQALLGQYMEADLQGIALGRSLDLAALAERSEEKHQPLLHHFLKTRWQLVLERAQLQAFTEQFMGRRRDAQPQFVLGELRFYRHRERLYGEPRGLADQSPPALQPWSVKAELATPFGRLSARLGGGFAPRGEVTVGFRQGGERCRLAGDACSRSLKKLLQQWDIPPLQRQRLPLIFCDGELAAIADLAICEGYKADDGRGWHLSWQDVAQR